MKLFHKLLFASVFALSITSCTKKGCTDPTAANYDSIAEEDDGNCDYTYNVPSEYVFTDGDGNSTVSYSVQTARMDMLSEMVSYLKTANNDPAVTLSATDLLAMYDNSYNGWSDADLVGNGKQLKSKTALDDAGIQSMFEGWMNAAAAATITGRCSNHC